MAQEATSGVADIAGGKKVRTLELQVLQPDGSTATVEVQVVAFADKTGRLADFPSDTETVRLLRSIDARLEQIEHVQCGFTRD